MIRRLRAFLATETAGGVVMIMAAVLALTLANSPLSETYHWATTTTLLPGWSLGALTKDALMTLFFFAVGMELKIELREGALSQPGQALLPLVAAIGGVVLPALMYLTVTHAHPALRSGWAIPTATDIAFALCVLRLAGPTLPHAAKIFLLAIAIYDDLAAILIIALFYSQGLQLLALLAVACVVALMWLLNRRHVCHTLPYLLLGTALWEALHQAGIHPTVAGVATGMFIPLAHPGGTPLLAPLLHRVHPLVAFLVMPLFAFTAAGVSLEGLTFADLLAPLPLAIVLALFLGKQVGIVSGVLLATRARLCALPEGVTLPIVYGISIFAGIGFTMSLFIGTLAFSEASMRHALTLGVLAASLLASGFGLFYLRLACPRPTARRGA